MDKTFAELGTEWLSPLWPAAPCRACHGTGLPQSYPGAPVQHQTTQRSHLWKYGRGLKHLLLEPGQGHTAFGGSPNHAHKRCNKCPQPANFGSKYLILWALLQHARWTWTLPLSFIFTHTTWNRHTLNTNSESSLIEVKISCFGPSTDLPCFKLLTIFWLSKKLFSGVHRTGKQLFIHTFTLFLISSSHTSPLNIYIINN